MDVDGVILGVVKSAVFDRHGTRHGGAVDKVGEAAAAAAGVGGAADGHAVEGNVLRHLEQYTKAV